VLVTVGPMDDLANNFVFGHMIQHTLLLEEISLLLALGADRARPRAGHDQARAPAVARADPSAAESEVVHLCEHACFVAAGALM
jgi:hypothetical protein